MAKYINMLSVICLVALPTLLGLLFSWHLAMDTVDYEVVFNLLKGGAVWTLTWAFVHWNTKYYDS